jgi:hypothetical protein
MMAASALMVPQLAGKPDGISGMRLQFNQPTDMGVVALAQGRVNFDYTKPADLPSVTFKPDTNSFSSESMAMASRGVAGAGAATL